MRIPAIPCGIHEIPMFMRDRIINNSNLWSPNGLFQAPNTTKHIVGRSSDLDHCGKLTLGEGDIPPLYTPPTQRLWRLKHSTPGPVLIPLSFSKVGMSDAAFHQT